MQSRKKVIWSVGFGLIAVIGLFFFNSWYQSHHAIRYAVSPSAVIAITGSDYETTLNKLHNISLINVLENDGSLELLQPNDFLKLELAHAPGFKSLFKNKLMVLSFKVGAKNQLESLLAIEANQEKYDSLIHEVLGNEYTISKYSSPSGELMEVYNAQKQKELVISYAYGVIVISNEALFAEETLKSIRNHESLFKKARFDFTSNTIYLKQAAMQKWVDNITQNNTSEFYQWFENIDECEFKLNAEGTFAKANLFFSKNATATNLKKAGSPFLLESWLQNITTTFIAYHPETGTSEIKVSELYRCYAHLQDENISNTTFIMARVETDSMALCAALAKHAIEQLVVSGNRTVYKFGKHPFFKNFCNSATPDLPETYITLISKNVFVVTSSISSLVPIIQKLNAYPVSEKATTPAVFLMQVQPQILLPYFGSIIKTDYRSDLLNSSFLQHLDFVQYRLDTIVEDRGVGTVLLNRNATGNSPSTELLWSKTLEEETAEIKIVRGVNAGEGFFLYQDERNVLHCFDYSAKELWQKFILGKIQSTINRIDLYRDGQHQFLFNTANQIYALDFKGNDMMNFPKQIYNDGIQGMYLFDMGDKYEYFFVKTNVIYGFDAGGASLEDWRPKESPVDIEHALLHFKKRNKNYIVGINYSGEVLIWNRFGKIVEKDIDFGVPIRTDIFVTPGINKKYRPELISIDTSGEIFSVTLDSLQKKEYKYKLVSTGVKHFVVQNTDSTFQKIVYEYKSKLLFFDRYSQTTDSLLLENSFHLEHVFDVDEKLSFMVLSDGNRSKIISSHQKMVADNIEGDILGIMSDEIPNHYFVITFDQLKRVNLYKFAM